MPARPNLAIREAMVLFWIGFRSRTALIKSIQNDVNGSDVQLRVEMAREQSDESVSQSIAHALKDAGNCIDRRQALKLLSSIARRRNLPEGEIESQLDAHLTCFRNHRTLTATDFKTMLLQEYWQVFFSQPCAEPPAWVHTHTTECPPDCGKFGDLRARVAHKMTQQEFEETITETFAAVDTAQTGHIQDSDVPAAVSSLLSLVFTNKQPWPPLKTQAEVQRAISELDRSFPGFIDLHQFRTLLSSPSLAHVLAPFDVSHLTDQSESTQSCLPEVEKLLLVAKGFWSQADKESSSQIKSQLNKSEFLGFLLRLWSYMTAHYQWDGAVLEGNDLPGRVRSRLDRFDEYLFFVDWSEFLEMLCETPWKLLLPPWHRAEVALVIQSSNPSCHWTSVHTASCLESNKQLVAQQPEQRAPAKRTSQAKPALNTRPHALSLGHKLGNEASSKPPAPVVLNEFEQTVWKVFDRADADGSGDLNAEEVTGLVTLLWECIGREMPQCYHSKIPKVVQDTLAQYGSLPRGCIRFTEFCEMVCCSPWRLLVPAQQREQMVMTRLRARENQKRLSPQGYPAAIPPPPPSWILQASHSDTTPGQHPSRFPEDLAGIVAAGAHTAGCVESEGARGSESIEGLLRGLELGHLVERFKQEGFEQLHDLLAVQSQLGDADLVELGVTKMMDRKKLLKALSESHPLMDSSPPPASRAPWHPAAPSKVGFWLDPKSTPVFGLPRAEYSSPSPDVQQQGSTAETDGYDPFRVHKNPVLDCVDVSYSATPSAGRLRGVMYDAVRRGKPVQACMGNASESGTSKKIGAVRPMPTTTQDTLITKEWIGFHNRPPKALK